MDLFQEYLLNFFASFLTVIIFSFPVVKFILGQSYTMFLKKNIKSIIIYSVVLFIFFSLFGDMRCYVGYAACE